MFLVKLLPVLVLSGELDLKEEFSNFTYWQSSSGTQPKGSS